jgi:phosphoesterase RecJ-like protein
MNDLQRKIKHRIREAGSILVTSHIRPDGDAIGSSLALTLALLEAGKQVQVVLTDGLPKNFRHLPGSELVKKRADGEFDLIICLDCSDLARVGKALDGYGPPDIVIDHHATNDAFGTLNLIDTEAVATASVLIRSMRGWGLIINEPIAVNLMTGIVTDSIGFRTPNTNSEALRQAAELLELGVDMSNLYFLSLLRQTFPAAKYWGTGLTNLQMADGIVWTRLTLSDRKAAGYCGNDDADLINVLTSIDEAKIAIVLVEQNKNKTKISWRAMKPGMDVSQIACQFGGGGHKAAAGAEVAGSLQEVQERVLEATRGIIKG